MNGGDDYEKDLTSSDEMEFLARTNDLRCEEEISRPRVEIWPYDEWQAWVALHEKGKRNVLCQLRSMVASPFCAVGYH